jgi:hypothetical protein
MLHPAAFNFGSMRRLRVSHSEFCSEGFTDSVWGGLHYNDSFHAMQTAIRHSPRRGEGAAKISRGCLEIGAYQLVFPVYMERQFAKLN